MGFVAVEVRTFCVLEWENQWCECLVLVPIENGVPNALTKRISSSILHQQREQQHPALDNLD